MAKLQELIKKKRGSKWDEFHEDANEEMNEGDAEDGASEEGEDDMEEGEDDMEEGE